MTQITNGTVTFERNRKTADYEGKRASVSLSFVIPEGEDPEAAIASIGLRAMLQAFTMVGEQAPQQAAAVPPTQPAPAPATRGRGKAAQQTTQTADAPPATAPTQVADPFGANAAQDTSAASDTGASQPASSADDPRLTNDGMRAAITRKVDAAKDRTATSAGIRDLVASYTGDRISPIYTVEDPAKRAEFLDKLAAL